MIDEKDVAVTEEKKEECTKEPCCGTPESCTETKSE